MNDASKFNDTDIAALAASVKAPAALHERVREMVDDATERGRHARTKPVPRAPRLRLAGVVAGVAAVAAAVIVALSVTGGNSGAPMLQQAMALTLSPSRMTPPQESKDDRSQLDVRVEGVAFPYWEERFGWRSSGARIDRLAGRSVTTVFYSNADGRRIGYAIVSGPMLATVGGTVVWRGGVPYSVLVHGGATAVAWPRDGHLCVISGRGMSSGELLRLASWSRPGKNRARLASFAS